MEKWQNNISRRKFIKLVGAGTLGLGLTSFSLTGCTTKQVEIFVQHLGELVQLINDYRKQNSLAEIPLSGSLTAVALKHVFDLSSNHPEKLCGEKGNTHSWSSNENWTGVNGEGNWKGCCYPGDPSNYACMWDKPKEIANYPGYGYEIAHWSSGTATAQGALNSWKGSSSHNDVILNKGIWKNRTWNAIGAVYGGNYACAWFGEVEE
jgi:hypothetical protein